MRSLFVAADRDDDRADRRVEGMKERQPTTGLSNGSRFMSCSSPKSTAPVASAAAPAYADSATNAANTAKYGRRVVDAA